MNRWMIDGKHDLTALVVANGMHLGSAIRAAQMEFELSRADAEAFVNFWFCDYAATSDGSAEEYLSADQFERLAEIAAEAR